MNAKPLALVFTLIGLAVATWFLWGGGEDPVVQPTAPTTKEAGNPADGADPKVGEGSVSEGTVAPESGSIGGVSERTAAETGATEPGSNEVTIRGQLVDSDATAMPDVELRFGVWKNPQGIEFMGRPRRDLPTSDLRTGPDGKFEVELARDESGLIDLVSSELVFAKSPTTVHGRNGNQDLGAITAHRSAIITGLVHDERGSPVAGVNVAALRGSLGIGSMSDSTTGEDGKFVLGKLRAGKWMLRTASAQHLPTTEEMTVEAGERINDLVLVVAPGRAIVGQVVDDLGRPVPEFRVGAKRVEERAGIDIERFSGDEATKTDANGFFTLSGLSTETATVRASGPGHASTFAADVPVGTGNLLLRVERLAVVEGILRGADGGALAGSRVRAVSATDNTLSAYGIAGVIGNGGPAATTVADGSFRIENVKPGTVTISADGKMHRPVKQTGVQVAPAQTVRGVQLVADRGAVVHLTVIDDDGNPVAGAKVRAEKPPENARNRGGMRIRSRRVEDNENGFEILGEDTALGTAVTDDKGMATIAGLPAGSAALHAEHTDFAAARPVTLPLMRNGTMEATLELRTPGYADLRIAGADGSTAVAAYRVRGPLGASDSESRKGKSDAEGKAIVGPLAAGNYIAELLRESSATSIGGATMVIEGDEGNSIGGTEQRFTVKAGDTTVVKVRRPVLTRVFGTVTGVDGPVAGCAVEIKEKDSGGPMMPGMGGGRTVIAAADGTFSIDDVERGQYVLSYGRPEQIVKAEAEINVPAELAELRQDLVLRTGRIRVQAWSEADGKGLANAEVRISRAPVGGAQAAPRRRAMVMMVSIDMDSSGGGDSTMMTLGDQRAKTGVDGWAEIEDVPVGNYNVRVTHPKHAPVERSDVAVSELQTAEVGRVAMTQAGRIRGKVLDKDGNPVRMGLVFHRPIDGEEGQPTPAMGGAFTIPALPPGRYVLRGQEMNLGGGGASASSPEVEVEVKGGETATADLRLPGK